MFDGQFSESGPARKIPPKSILALTYTVRSAEHLKSEISKVISNHSHNINAYNFHSFSLNQTLKFYKILGYSESPVLIEKNYDINKGGWVLSFDDGGVSAFDNVMASLDRLTQKAHFFITTDYIGRKGFLDKRQIAILKEQGHSIGSHSCSHPNMAKLKLADLVALV